MGARNPTNGRQDKSADLRSGACGWLGWIFRHIGASRLLALLPQRSTISTLRAPSPPFPEARAAMTTRDDDLRVRPGRIRHGNRGAKRPKTFVGEVMRAAKKAGHRRQHVRPQRAARRALARSGAAGAPPCLCRLALRRSARRDEGARSSAIRARGSARRRCRSTSPISSARASPATARTRGCSTRRSDDADERGLRRALRGRPPSFPVHRLARGRGRDGDLRDLHPRADGRRRA